MHELGECEVKHGVRVSVVNFYTNELGNPVLPEKFKSAGGKITKPSRFSASTLAMIGGAILVVLAIAAVVFVSKRSPKSAAASSDSQTQSVSIPEKSIAVLPFENLSDNKENAYFADGVQDEILTNLAKIADLKVISRTSVMQYKTDTSRNSREIGKQLGVAHLLEGSVRRVGNQVRVNAQLIDTRTDAHIWAEFYDRELDDVFAIQSEIAKTIAEQLQAKLSPSEKAAIEKPATTDLNAYDLYLRAQSLFADSSNQVQARGESNSRRRVSRRSGRARSAFPASRGACSRECTEIFTAADSTTRRPVSRWRIAQSRMRCALNPSPAKLISHWRIIIIMAFAITIARESNWPAREIRCQTAPSFSNTPVTLIGARAGGRKQRVISSARSIWIRAIFSRSRKSRCSITGNIDTPMKRVPTIAH